MQPQPDGSSLLKDGLMISQRKRNTMFAALCDFPSTWKACSCPLVSPIPFRPALSAAAPCVVSVLCTVSVNHPESLGHKKPDRPRLCLGRGRGRQRRRRRRWRRQRRIGDWEQSGRGGRGEWGAGADLRRRRWQQRP